ncbi:MAG: phosphoribosylamine--glycine ligase [Bacillota bacterium]
MKVLVIGSGGREAALVWKLAQSLEVDQIFAAPGNVSTAKFGENIAIAGNQIDELLEFALAEDIEWTIVGPEAPLVAGIVDYFQRAGLQILGPTKQAAQLEGSKVFAKQLMEEQGIPTAEYEVFSTPQPALEYIKQSELPLVIKAEGLAGGKGVTVAQDRTEAITAVEELMIERKFGQAGQRIIIEEYLEGKEVTVLAVSDGQEIIPLLPACDHKPVYEGGRGPNTGGMGAYAPASVVDQQLLAKIKQKVLEPTIAALAQKGVEYRGILYAGLMITDEEFKVLEYNVRLGDPEAQVLLPLLKTDLVELGEAINQQQLSKLELEWYAKSAATVIITSEGYPLDYKTGYQITGVHEVAAMRDNLLFQAGTKKQGSELVTAGGRVLGVTGLGTDLSAAIKKAYQGVEEIDFKGAYYRQDIGPAHLF